VLKDSCDQTVLLNNKNVLKFRLKQSFYIDICGMVATSDLLTIEKSLLNAWRTIYPGKKIRQFLCPTVTFGF
jgi:hypothetical protein